jgi:integrase
LEAGGPGRQNVAAQRLVHHAWRAALAAADLRVQIMLRLAGEAGLRRGEVSRVHTRDLLEGSGGAQLVVHGKGGKERVVPISDSLAEALRSEGSRLKRDQDQKGGWLFPNGTGGHLTAYHVGQLVVRVLPDGWTMHTLRHRFASRAYRGTRNLRAVQVLLGHESIATTERYTAVDDDEIRAAMESAGA